MMIKSGGLLYLFDFDGTLSGSNRWKNLLINNIDCYRSGAYLNPSKFDIRWSILTARPKIDKLFVKIFCALHGLSPEKINTTDTLLYPFKKNEDVFEWKASFIKDVLDGKRSLNIRPLKIDKVVYVDNDQDCVRYINSKKEDYRYLAISVKDFYEQKISFVLI